ncbi:hypothetical protein OAG56_01335 [Mariniblastus sp.]|jgi:Zn-finger nucleic acid-binding protein|nr:hypothetical protein [Mariniblastus sp.]MDB4670543.1 hypothetical protein [Pirellulaceae bacterium]MDB4755986.1 hypothetical protein [Mariniblastus sp.]
MNQPAAQNPDGHFGALQPITSLGEAAPAPCPRCSGLMELAELESKLVILCTDCRGVLISSMVLGEIIAQLRRQYRGKDIIPPPLDEDALSKRIDCPNCGRKMDVHPYHGPSNVVIDSCSKCWLTFLDDGELSTIQLAPGER